MIMIMITMIMIACRARGSHSHTRPRLHTGWPPRARIFGRIAIATVGYDRATTSLAAAIRTSALCRSEQASIRDADAGSAEPLACRAGCLSRRHGPQSSPPKPSAPPGASGEDWSAGWQAEPGAAVLWPAEFPGEDWQSRLPAE